MTTWTTFCGDVTDRDLRGECSFRLMPSDALAPAPATARVSLPAKGIGLLVRYTWQHPDDGPQEGVLLAGAPDQDDPTVTATWLDSWHQQPATMQLLGRVEGDTALFEGTYAETWGWQIEITRHGEGLSLVMRNVIPAEAAEQAPEGVTKQAGPYDVMVMRVR